MSPLGTPSIKAFAASISLCISLKSYSIELRRSIMEKYDMVPIATAARMAIKLRAGSEILVFSESFMVLPLRCL